MNTDDFVNRCYKRKLSIIEVKKWEETVGEFLKKKFKLLDLEENYWECKKRHGNVCWRHFTL